MARGLAPPQACSQGALALSKTEVRAAGGVVVRRLESGERHVLIVHRPRYDDWSLPKGKNEPNEPDPDCAVREVEEETGYRCEVRSKVAEVHYRDQKDRPKRVVYFLMEPRDGAFSPNDEVDAVRWWPAGEARTLLTYPHEADAVDAALEADSGRFD